MVNYTVDQLISCTQAQLTELLKSAKKSHNLLAVTYVEQFLNGSNAAG